jgi:SAM-dependent methyltransferase
LNPDRPGGPQKGPAGRDEILPPSVYDADYYLSEAVEGHALWLRGEMSALRGKHLALLAPAPGMDLLEIGFARGELLRECALAGARCTGLDYSPDACAIARGTLDAAGAAAVLVRGDCRALPFPDASFDRVFAGDVIEHLAWTGGVRLLAEMGRVLRPGGFLLLHTTPNRTFHRRVWPALRPLLRLWNPGLVRGMDGQFAVMDRVHLCEHTPAMLRRAARAAGLPPRRTRVWTDPDLLRGGEHRLTESLGKSPLFRAAAAVAALPPLLPLLGNDLYLRHDKP